MESVTEETSAQRPTNYFSKQRILLLLAFETLGDWLHPASLFSLPRRTAANLGVLSSKWPVFQPPNQRSLIGTLP
jgi:hypothetical protein